MFYSHESEFIHATPEVTPDSHTQTELTIPVLTSPEHGVATVWLAATLGPKSTTRKINRKAIFDVNVPGACRVITDPEVPMALRLQGSMLYVLSTPAGPSTVVFESCSNEM
ncbi:unnamed protein product [Penicillium manginii]